MDCIWCSRGVKLLRDDDIIEKLELANSQGDQTMFHSASEDLLHSLYHKARLYLSYDDAMDVVLDAAEKLWAWMKQQYGERGSDIEQSAGG